MTRHAVPARRKGLGHIGPTVEKKRRKKRTKDYVVRGAPKGREETTDVAEIQQWHKGPRPETGATCGKQEDIMCGPRTNSRVGWRS
jgi:hypothetical protein